MTPEQREKLVERMIVELFGKFMSSERYDELFDATSSALTMAEKAIRDDVLEEAAQQYELTTGKADDPFAAFLRAMKGPTNET